jgi:5-aminolevulinate synthase
MAAPSTGPRGGTMSNLQVIARRCPVMSKALAVQSSRLASKNFTFAAAGISVSSKLKTFEKVSRCPLHTTAGNGASVDVGGTYEKSSRRKYSLARLGRLV